METNLVQFTQEQITNGRIASRIQKVPTSKEVINNAEEDNSLWKEVDLAVAADMAVVEEATINNITTIIIINSLISIITLQMIRMLTIQRKLAMVAIVAQEIAHYHHHHHLVTIKAIRIIIINNIINGEDLVFEEQVTAIAISVTTMAQPITITIQINHSLLRIGTC